MISAGFEFDRAIAASNALYDYFCAIIAERRAQPVRRRDLGARAGRARRRAPRRRADLLVPAVAAARRRRDDVPLVEQPALRTAHQPRPARRARATTASSCRRRSKKGCGGSRRCSASCAPRRATPRSTACRSRPARSSSVNLGSANHDERYWDHAEEFDIFRKPRQHIAFAWGPHMCLGLHLARMETRVALTQVFDRLPNLRLDPDAEPPFITGAIFRAPHTLCPSSGTEPRRSTADVR